MSRRAFVGAILSLPLLARSQKVPPSFPIKEFLARGKLTDQFPNLREGKRSEFGEHQLFGMSVNSTAVLQVFGPRPGTVSRGGILLDMNDEVTRRTGQEHIFLGSMFVACFGIPAKGFNSWFSLSFDRVRNAAMEAKTLHAEEAIRMAGYNVKLMHNVSEAASAYAIDVMPTPNGK